MTLYYGDLVPYLSMLLHGLWISVWVTVVAMIIGSLFGIALYLGKNGEVSVLRAACRVYIEIFRNTPLLVQLYLIYFGLPQLGLNINPLWSALIGLALNNAAYTAEIYRAGIQSVPIGMREASMALGMRSSQTFRYVVLMPAVRAVFPALTNQFILLFLASSIASIISLPELTDMILKINAETYRTIEVFSIGGAMYLVISILLSLGSRSAGKKIFAWAGQANG